MIAIDGRPRSLAEMRFAAGLYPCSGCRSHDIGAVELAGTGKHRVLHAPCPRCRTPRELQFEVGLEPIEMRAPALQLGGDQPSRAIRPVQLVEELDRLAPLVVWDPAGMTPAAWHENAAVVERAATCLNELVKFVPDGEPAIPDVVLDDAGRIDRRARPERYEIAWLREERARYLALVDQRQAAAARVPELERRVLPARGELTRAAVEAHGRWLARRGADGSRLDIAYFDAQDAQLGACDLSLARLHAIVIDRAELAFSTLARAELTEISAVQADLHDSSFAGARIVRSDFRGAYLALARFDDAVIGGGRWDRAILDAAAMPRARFAGVSLRDAELGNAALDDATFVDCDLRGASFAIRTPDLLGTTRGARFERCDLRETKWTERDLDGAVFVDCRFAGASGRPRRHAGLVATRADLSRAGDGTRIGSAKDVLFLLGADA